MRPLRTSPAPTRASATQDTNEAPAEPDVLEPVATGAAEAGADASLTEPVAVGRVAVSGAVEAASDDGAADVTGSVAGWLVADPEADPVAEVMAAVVVGVTDDAGAVDTGPALVKMAACLKMALDSYVTHWELAGIAATYGIDVMAPSDSGGWV